MMLGFCYAGYRNKMNQLTKQHVSRISRDIRHLSTSLTLKQNSHLDEKKKVDMNQPARTQKLVDEAAKKLAAKYKEDARKKYKADVIKKYKQKAAENIKEIANQNKVKPGELPTGYLYSINLHYHKLAQKTIENFPESKLEEKMKTNPKIKAKIDEKVNKVVDEAKSKRVELKKKQDTWYESLGKQALNTLNDVGNTVENTVSEGYNTVSDAADSVSDTVCGWLGCR
jgi:uncharacterized membrane-anchored protein YjiN (DUF445 family)